MPLVRPNSVQNLFVIPLLVFVAGACVHSTAFAEEILVKSPNQGIIVAIDRTAAGQLTQSVRFKEQAVLAPSALGIQVNNQTLGKTATLGRPSTRRVRETYPVHGGHRTALNQYDEAVIPVTESIAGGKWNNFLYTSLRAAVGLVSGADCRSVLQPDRTSAAPCPVRFSQEHGVC